MKGERVGTGGSHSKDQQRSKRRLNDKRGVRVYSGAEAVLQREDYLVNSSKHRNLCSCAGLDGPFKGCVFVLNSGGPT